MSKKQWSSNDRIQPNTLKEKNKAFCGDFNLNIEIHKVSLYIHYSASCLPYGAYLPYIYMYIKVKKGAGICIIGDKYKYCYYTR